MSTRVGDTTLASLLLVSRLVESDAAPLKSSEFWPLLERVGDPARLLGETATALAAFTGSKLDPERLLKLLSRGTALAFELEKLEQLGIRTVVAGDEAYPQLLRERLGIGAPPFLHAAGPLELLNLDALGIVGSRNVSAEGAKIAQEAAREGVVGGLSIVSGGAKGVDQLAMAAALDSGGRVVGVLADSMLKALRVPDTRRAVADGSVCLCTPYKPDAGFNAGNAMGRNKIIYGLSTVTFVVASDLESGGTWAGAAEALKKNYARVAVWTGAGGGPGNKALIALGAGPVDSVERILKVQTHGAAPPQSQQATFWS